MKVDFIKELMIQIRQNSDYLEFEDYEMVEIILNRNFKRLIISFSQNTEFNFLSGSLKSMDLGDDGYGSEDHKDNELSDYKLKITKSEHQTLGKFKLIELEMLIEHFLFSKQKSVHTLNRSEPNTLNSIGHSFSIPVLNSNPVPKLKHLKMEIMGQLFRVYRSRKHLDFTSTRSYLNILS